MNCSLFLMGKLGFDNKMHIHMLCEQHLGPKAIMKLYPDKNLKSCTVKCVCRRIDGTRSAENSAKCFEHCRGQWNALFSRRPTWDEQERLSELVVGERSVRQIAKVDLNTSSVLSVSVKQKRLDHCKELVRHLTIDNQDCVVYRWEKFLPGSFC